jgi:hypothetical protein
MWFPNEVIGHNVAKTFPKSPFLKFLMIYFNLLISYRVDNLYYKGQCLSVCQHLNVPTLTSPPILKLWDTQGYLWLPYDLTKVIKLIGEIFEPKTFFSSNKILYVIPSALLSFFPYYCHSFQIIVIPSILLPFLPDYCHSVMKLWVHQRITNTN